MQMRTIIDRKPSAGEEKSLRDPWQVQRERKLWSFLTWSFLLAQIAIAEKLFGSSAQAAIDDGTVSGGAEPSDKHANASGNVADVPAFSGSIAPQTAIEAANSAGRFELSSKIPAEGLPDLDQGGGDALGLVSPIPGISISANSLPQSNLTASGNPNSADLDSASPDFAGEVAVTIFDLFETATALDISLDTYLVNDLLDVLGGDLDLSFDADALGLIGDVGSMALGTMDDLPLLGNLIPTDAAQLLDIANLNISTIGSSGSLLAINHSPAQTISNLTHSGQQTDFMIALTIGDDPADPADTSSAPASSPLSFIQSMPIVDVLQGDPDEDLGELAATVPVVDDAPLQTIQSSLFKSLDDFWS